MTPSTKVKVALAALAVTGAMSTGARPAAAAAAGVRDDFGRTSTSGWGAEEGGSPYVPGTIASGSALWTDGTDGKVRLGTPGSGLSVAQPDVRLVDTEVSTAFSTSKVSTGSGQIATVWARAVAPLNEYRLRTRMVPDGTVALSFALLANSHTEAAIGSELALTGLRPAVGQAVHVRGAFVGTNPTTLRARAWLEGTTEPTTWQIVRSDATPALQAAGAVGLRSYVSGSTTNAPVDFSYRHLRAAAPGAVLSAAAPTTTTTTTAPAPAPPYGAMPLGSTSHPVPAGAIVVSPSGSDIAAGTWAAPFRTFAKAVAMATDGATIVLRAGTYHEQVMLAKKQRITIQSAPGEVVWFDGSSRVDGWTPDGTAWAHAGWTTRLPRISLSDGLYADPGTTTAAYPDQVFVDGTALRQVTSRSAVAAGTFFLDEATSVLYVGTDPTGREVRASDLHYAIDVNQSPNAVLRGFGVRRYGTPATRMAALFVQGPDAILEDLVVVENAAAGISLSALRPTATRITSSRNGQLGVHTRLADGLRITSGLFDGNNTAGFNPRHAAGGVKITSSRGITVADTQSNDNDGPGIWLDESCIDGTIVRDRAMRNTRSGFHIELSARTTLAGNVAVDNARWGIYVLESNAIRVWNNTLIRNDRAVQVMEGVRQHSNPADRGHDPRYGTNNPGITWDVADVQIRNNVYSGARELASPSLFGADDSRKLLSGQAMGITADHNAFYRGPTTTSPKHLGNWPLWPTKMAVGAKLADWRSVSGQDAHSILAEGVPTSPFVTDEAGGRYAAPSTSAAATGGTTPPSDIVALLGAGGRTSFPMGVLA